MIVDIQENDIPECVQLIRESFATVAEQFGITQENAPRFTAFATTQERLWWHLEGEHRPMRGFRKDGKLVGYYSLLPQENGSCELNNLCVLPAYRHHGIGERLLEDAFALAKGLGRGKINISFVAENRVLGSWYEQFGFVPTDTKKFDFFPFTCGYMAKGL